jgi:hypothetical protein
MQRDVVILSCIKKLATVIAWALLCNAQAAELGEPHVSSFLDQPLLAEVELIGQAGDESMPLQVRLAPIDVYRGANISFNPVLSSVHLVLQRQGQRQVLRISSDQAIHASHLILFLELTCSNERTVRALTIWLNADPNAANVPSPEAEPNQLADNAVGAATKPEEAQDEAMHGGPSVAAVAAAIAAMEARHHAARVRLAHRPAASQESCPANDDARIQRCIASERENLIISAHIQELEKSVVILQQTLGGNVDASATQDNEAIAAESVAVASQTTKVVHPKAKKSPPLVIPWKIIGFSSVVLIVVVLCVALVRIARRRKFQLMPIVRACPARIAAFFKKFLPRKKASTENPDAAVEPMP